MILVLNIRLSEPNSLFPSEKCGGKPEWEKEVDNYFSARLASTSAWNSVISLNEAPVKDVQNGMLVRFRGN